MTKIQGIKIIYYLLFSLQENEEWLLQRFQPFVQLKISLAVFKPKTGSPHSFSLLWKEYMIWIMFQKQFSQTVVKLIFFRLTIKAKEMAHNRNSQSIVNFGCLYPQFSI